MTAGKSLKTLFAWLAGGGLMVSGLIGLLVRLIAVFDPFGTKLADDGTAVGSSLDPMTSLMATLLWLAVIVIGFFTIRWGTWNRVGNSDKVQRR